MNRVQFQKLLDSQGSDLAKWQEADRLAAQDLIARDASADEALYEARCLDRLIERGLADEQFEKDQEAVASRILSRLPKTLPSQACTILKEARPRVWFGLEHIELWPRVAALAVAAALGIAVGLFSAERRVLEDQWETIAALDETSTDLNAVLFDTETMTGISR